VARLRELEFVDHPASHRGYPAVRTLPESHQYIKNHWDELKTGDVIDVEYITGETLQPKQSQAIEEMPGL
jgi:hypothetical protein